MARLIICKKLLLRNAAVSSRSLSPSLLRHHYSTKPQGQLVGVDLSSSSSSSPSIGEHEVTLKLFDDLINKIMVKRATPDWLPFVPGSSFWVPPRPTPSNVVDLVQKLTNDLNEEELLSLSTVQGFPSSKFFIQECELARGEDSGKDTGMELNIPEGMESTVKVKVLTIPGNVAHQEDEEG